MQLLYKNSYTPPVYLTKSDFIMNIKIENRNQLTIVEVSGELNSTTSGQFQEKVIPLAGHGSRILLDLSSVNYMSSAGLRVLLLIYRQINEQHGIIVICGLSDEVKDTMAMTGFLDFFAAYDDRESALRALQAD